MTTLRITPDIAATPWSDLRQEAAEGALIHGVVDRVGMLPRGTTAGLATVAFAGRDDQDRPFVVEVSWAQLQTAYAALAASPVGHAELVR